MSEALNELADISTPLQLADGTKIDRTTGEVLGEEAPTLIEVPTHSDAVKIVTKTRRRIADLPDIPKRMHVIGAVLSYSLFGLDEMEIALATGMTVDQVGRVMVSDAYMALRDKSIEGIMSSETESVRALFTQGARIAAQTVTKLAATPNALGFRASQDVLNRAGMRPVDVIEHRHSLEGELRIVHIKRNIGEEIPILEGFDDAIRDQGEDAA